MAQIHAESVILEICDFPGSKTEIIQISNQTDQFS